MLRRTASKSLTNMVRLLTGQNQVWEFLCPDCYPEKVERFQSGEPLYYPAEVKK